MSKSRVVILLTLGFVLMEILMGGLLVLSLSGYAYRLYGISLQIIGVHKPRKTNAASLQAALLNERWATSCYLADGDAGERRKVQDVRALADGYIDRLRDFMTDDEWRAFSAGYGEYHALLDSLLYTGKVEADPQTLAGRTADVDETLSDLLTILDTVFQRADEQIRKEEGRYQNFFSRRFLEVLGVGVVLMVSGAWTGLTLTRSITKPLAQLTEAARRLGDGDLTAVPDVSVPNEIGALAESFRRMAGSLRQAIERMRQTAGALTASADHLSTSATGLSGLVRGTLAQMEQIAQGAEGQRQQVQVAAEVATGIVDALQQNVQQADRVGQAAQGAQDRLARAARTVAVLDKDATEIQTITSVIEQFAQETHMLALNAAIEARRAGEAGRGFAAVSDEMRALAERSAGSAGEVARFSARAQAEMESVGQAVVDVQEAVAQTADFAREVVDAARRQERDTARLADAVERAAEVSSDQARIAGQVSAAVADQVDAIAELATAAQELAEMSGQLENLAARFVIH